MKQSLFEARHHPQWQRFSEQLDEIERGRGGTPAAETFAGDYRKLCHQLALARERGYSSHLIDHLHRLAMRAHQQLYRHRDTPGAWLAGFVLAGFARRVRAERWFVLTAGLLFFSSLIGMGLLVYQFPELVYSVIDPEQVNEMESLYDPARSRIGGPLERESSEDWMMFGYYIMNNIGIAFQTYASGLLLGLGSLFFLLFNGLTIGAVAGHLTGAGSGHNFWSFVIAHGAFELTGITLAGAAGLKLGWAVLAPGRYGRAEALRKAGRSSIELMAGVILLLVIAAFIEAYWSSMAWPRPALKYLTGVLLWVVVVSYLTFAGRRAHAPD
ncbi:stage II sporulation protein M [Pseudomonas sp. JDS28PS106]|uniref:stage II sporulation protein M n=1 Tax=Pseudomonas sp. JDS28PS106 TaxID=2497235 RepID=UPI002FD17B35